MVEVIKHGEKNITECDFCGAQLRYSVEDLKTACELAFAKEVRKNVSTFSAKEETKPVNTFFAFAKTNHESSFLDGLLNK